MPLLIEKTIDAQALEDEVRRTHSGAIVIFQGVVRRDKTKAGEIDRLFYEAYEPMVESEMDRILAEVEKEWPGSEAVVRHRVGNVAAGETSVFIAVSSPERPKAFEACRYIIDQLKTTVPIWKKDIYTNGKSEWTASHHETMLLTDSPRETMASS